MNYINVRTRPTFREIAITFEKRVDGGLRVYSDDVPGFVLSNSDCEAVFSDIQPALETILSVQFDARVTVGPLEGLRDALETNGYLSSEGVPFRRIYVAQFPNDFDPNAVQRVG